MNRFQAHMLKLKLAETAMHFNHVTENEVDILEDHLGVRYFINHDGHMVFREIRKDVFNERQDIAMKHTKII